MGRFCCEGFVGGVGSEGFFRAAGFFGGFLRRVSSEGFFGELLRRVLWEGFVARVSSEGLVRNVSSERRVSSEELIAW